MHLGFDLVKLLSFDTGFLQHLCRLLEDVVDVNVHDVLLLALGLSIALSRGCTRCSSWLLGAKTKA